MKLYISVLIHFLFAPFFLFAQSIVLVPDDYAKIQDAINESAPGDTIIVAPGTYFENINFKGKDIYLTSNFYFDKDTSFITTTILDGSNHTDPDTGSVTMVAPTQPTTITVTVSDNGSADTIASY